MTIPVESSNFSECRSFTRGFLLASSWAVRCPDADVSKRVARLEGEDPAALYCAFRSLPRASRDSFRITWTKRERRVRLDEELDLHPSWIVDLLQHEPPATLLLALGEMNPELGREVLRTLWPRVKPRPGEEALVQPLDPSRAGDLRRQLFRRFAYLPPVTARSGPLDGLLRLDAQQTWSAAQQLGRDEISHVSTASPLELQPLFRELPPEQTALLDRLLGSNGEASITNIVASGGAKREPADSSRSALGSAIEHVRAVLGLAETESNAVGLIGLRVLAEAMSVEPRELCEQVGYRMSRPLAGEMLRWRDECTARDNDSARTAEVRKRVIDLCGSAA